jgi:hypothetical protein
LVVNAVGCKSDDGYQIAVYRWHVEDDGQGELAFVNTCDVLSVVDRARLTDHSAGQATSSTRLSTYREFSQDGDELHARYRRSSTQAAWRENAHDVDSTIYYSNGSAYCHFPGWNAYIKAGRQADWAKLPAPGALPTCMANRGAC